MAITATAVINNPTYKSWTITALDADTTGSFAHGFGATPDMVTLTEIFFEGTTNPNWSYSITATTLTLNKANAASSGGTTPGTTPILKVNVLLPNSMI